MNTDIWKKLYNISSLWYHFFDQPNYSISKDTNGPDSNNTDQQVKIFWLGIDL